MHVFKRKNISRFTEASLILLVPVAASAFGAISYGSPYADILRERIYHGETVRDFSANPVRVAQATIPSPLPGQAMGQTEGATTSGAPSPMGPPPVTSPPQGPRPGEPSVSPYPAPGTAPESSVPRPTVTPGRAPSRPFRRPEGVPAIPPGISSPAPVPQIAPAPSGVVPRGPTPPVRREPPAVLPAAPPPGSLVQMQFDNIELRDLIRFVSNVMGKNFIFDESIVKGKVTVLSPKSLTRDEVFRVFESVLNYQGFAIIQTPEALKIVRSADAKGLPVETIDRQDLARTQPAEKIATMINPLQYLDSNTMVGILRPLMARDAYLVSVPATNSLIMIDTEANLRRLNQVIAEVDLPVSKQLSAIDIYNVQHTNAADLAKVLQALLAEGKKAATPKEKIFITAYAPTNSLLVSAPPEDMKEIRRIIEEVDTFRPQVLVEAAIIEISVTKSQSLGVEWVTGVASSSGNAGVGFANVNPGGSLVPLIGALTNPDSAASTVAAASAIGTGLNIGVFGGNITFQGKKYPSLGAFIKAVATLDNVNILSTPQILTMNNEEAEIIVGENRPYLTSTRLDSAGNPINTFDYRDVGIKLKVKPYINKDGLVYLNVYQEVTQVTQATVGSGQNVQPAPTTLKRSTKTTVGVKDAQTIVISGLIRDDSTGTRTGIPVLSSVPLIGYLFGSRTTTAEKTNLLVFITPRIVYTAEALQKLSDTKKAEQGRLLMKGK